MSKNKIKIMSFALTICVLMTLSGCSGGNGSLQPVQTDSQDTKQFVETEPQDTKQVSEYGVEEGKTLEPTETERQVDGGRRNDDQTTVETDPDVATEDPTVSFEFNYPEGADSPYELYTAVCNYVIDGGKSEDLSSFFDIYMIAAFSTRAKGRGYEELSQGLSFDQTLALMPRLQYVMGDLKLAYENGVIDKDTPEQEYEPLFMDRLYHLYPECKSYGLDEKSAILVDFTRMMFFVDSEKDILERMTDSWMSESPVVNTVPEADFEYSVYETNSYYDFTGFPTVYKCHIADWNNGTSEYYVDLMFFEIDGKYYMYSFSYEGHKA